MPTTPSPEDVLARYGNWYHGADDLFAHCLIRRSRECVLIFQGSEVVTVKLHQAPAGEHEHLVDLLDQPIPAAWPQASYQGFNFITDPEGPAANEIAVYGVQPGDNRPPGQYYAAPADSEVAAVVKQIAQVD
jgi:hypothetical protein